MILVTLALAALARWYLPNTHDAGALWQQVTIVYIKELTTWLSCALCFFAFRVLFDKPSKISLYLTDSTYTIYLFHHLGVVVLGFLSLGLSVHVYFKFLLVVLLVSCYTLCMHHFLVSRFKVLRLLFNGKSG